MQSVYHHFFSHSFQPSKFLARQSAPQIWPADDFTCRPCRPADCHKQLPCAPFQLSQLVPHCQISLAGKNYMRLPVHSPDTELFTFERSFQDLGTLLPPGAPPDWAAGWAPCVPLLLLQSTLARTVRTSLQSRRSVRNAALLDLFPPSSTWPPVAILDPAQRATCQI